MQSPCILASDESYYDQNSFIGEKNRNKKTLIDFHVQFQPKYIFGRYFPSMEFKKPFKTES